MLTGNTLREATEQRLHDFCKLVGFDDVQHLLQLVEEHDFLGAVDLRPVFQEAKYDLEIVQLCDKTVT